MHATLLVPIILAVVLIPPSMAAQQDEQPTLSQLRLRARTAMQARRFKEASRLLEQIAEHDLNDGETWLGLGVCYLKQLRYGKAVEALQRAFDLDYEPSETSFQMAFAYARRKQEKEALKWLETAAALGFDRLSEAIASSAFLTLKDSPEFDRILLMIKKNLSPCEHSDLHSKLDFWLGEWEVYTLAGSQAGEDRIEKSVGGCLLLEDWKSISGTTGRSMTFYDAGREKWRQIWIDHRGSVIEVEGGFDYGKLSLAGVHTTVGGQSEKCRITLEPLPDGRVHQKIERSPDGMQWYVWFEGMYVRKAPEPE